MAAALQRSMLYKVLPLGGIESPRVAASKDLQVCWHEHTLPLPHLQGNMQGALQGALLCQ